MPTTLYLSALIAELLVEPEATFLETPLSLGPFALRVLSVYGT